MLKTKQGFALEITQLNVMKQRMGFTGGWCLDKGDINNHTVIRFTYPTSQKSEASLGMRLLHQTFLVAAQYPRYPCVMSQQ